MKVIPISEVKEFKTGDIFETFTFLPYVKHYAVLFYRKGVPYVADNSFTTKRIDVFTLEDYKKKRNIIGVIRTPETEKVTDARVEQKIIEHKPTGYKFFTFNCENFIRDICQCEFGLDQRWTYLVIIPAILISIFIGLYLLFKKYPITAKIILLFMGIKEQVYSVFSWWS